MGYTLLLVLVRMVDVINLCRNISDKAIYASMFSSLVVPFNKDIIPLFTIIYVWYLFILYLICTRKRAADSDLVFVYPLSDCVRESV